MILYLDSSSIAAIHLQESGRHDLLLRLIDTADIVSTSRLSYVEVRAGLAFANREPFGRPRLNDEAHRSAVIALDHDWPAFFRISPSERLILSAGALAERRRLKGYDSIQLATALELRRRVQDEISFSTWDKQLAAAAVAEGLPLAHEVN